jgi:Aspartyl protease
LRPTLDVHLECAPTGDWTTKALVDTGAPITVFDRGTADALGIRIGQAGAETGMVALLGKVRSVQFADVDIQIVKHPEQSWSAPVAFIKDTTFQMPFQGILGTRGFLDRFAVCFNHYYNYFELMQPDSAKAWRP